MRMAPMKNQNRTEQNRIGISKDGEELGRFKHSWWECKWYSHCGNQWFLKNVKQHDHVMQQFCLWEYSLKKWKQGLKGFYACVPTVLFVVAKMCNNTSVYHRTKKQANVTWTYSGILALKRNDILIGCNMGGPWGCHVKSNRSVTKRQVLYDSICMR